MQSQRSTLHLTICQVHWRIWITKFLGQTQDILPYWNKLGLCYRLAHLPPVLVSPIKPIIVFLKFYTCMVNKRQRLSFDLRHFHRLKAPFLPKVDLMIKTHFHVELPIFCARTHTSVMVWCMSFALVKALACWNNTIWKREIAADCLSSYFTSSRQITLWQCRHLAQ